MKMTMGSARRWGVVVTMVAALAMAGCATKVTRMEADETKDLSGEWNDTDSQLVSKEMVTQMLEGAWISDYSRETGKKPAVIVGEVRNLSHEHLAVGTFIGDIERAVINSGRVQFVASRDERGDIRAERKDQDLNASEATRNAMGQERGASFMLKGTINTIIDSEGKSAVRYYQVDLTLISMADNTKVWVGQKKIKKLVEKNSLRF